MPSKSNLSDRGIGILKIKGQSGSEASYQITNKQQLTELLPYLLDKNFDTLSSISFEIKTNK